MEPIEITGSGNRLHIEGFPDAVKVVGLLEPDARTLADLSSHRSDLAYAADCFSALNETAADPPVLREALWRSALVAYFKCFGTSGARATRLDPRAIYKDEDPLALENFQHLKHLRNKHVVHDENAWTQERVFAILNPEHADCKIAKVAAMVLTGHSLSQQTGSLYKLITIALLYVDAECDRLCQQLCDQLEPRPYHELAARPNISYTPPTAGEVGERRTRH